MAMPGTPGSTASFSGAGGATPVFVVNMPGGGGMGGPISAPPGPPASGPTGGGGGGGLNWDALAAKESSGNWKTNTGNGFYGGLQFDDSTWKQYGGDKIAPRADLASKEDQIAIAQKAFDARGGGSSLWPANFGQLTTPLPAPGSMGGGGGGPGMGMPQGMGFGFPLGPNIGPAPLGGGVGTGVGGVNPFSSPFAPGGVLGGPTLPMPGQVGPPGGGGAAPGTMGPFPVPNGMGTPGGPIVPPPGQLGGGQAPPAAGIGTGATQIGGVTPGVAMGGQGGIGLAPGGTIDTAIGAAAAGLDLLAPGAGQAAQTGMKLANRAIQQAGQVAAIGVGGLMETFLPTGGSELANSGWLPRIAGGLAGAKAALPNIAGGKGDAQPPLTPDQAKQQQGQTAPPGQGPNIGVTINNNNASPDQNMAQADWHAQQMYAGAAR